MDEISLDDEPVKQPSGSIRPFGFFQGVDSRPPGFGYCFAVFGLALGLLFASKPLQGSQPTEYEVKAAYLYNFGNFVVWRSDSAEAVVDSFAICVLGQDPFGPVLDATVNGESIGGKKVAVRRLSKVQDATGCRILFISSSEENQLKDIVTSLEKASVLTVSDIPEFVRRGGMVQFVLEQNKVRFEINLWSAQRAGLTVSSQLLKLATNVRKNPQAGER